LGLPIVEVALAQLGGGKLELENAAGGGLRATLSFPNAAPGG
jgi:signal transduction histidine kinase